nr:LysR family transcriptional regulator [Streptomyces hokutonensis]
MLRGSRPDASSVLAEVARTGTCTAAADALDYTQPAVSYQMGMLERSVGAPLVTRRGRGVQLTPEGRALARHAETVLAALRTAEDELAALTAPEAGRIRLSAMQSSCVSLVPRALGALRRTRPELEVTVTQSECRISHGLLLEGAVELAVMCDLDFTEKEQEKGGEKEGEKEAARAADRSDSTGGAPYSADDPSVTVDPPPAPRPAAHRPPLRPAPGRPSGRRLAHGVVGRTRGRAPGVEVRPYPLPGRVPRRRVRAPDSGHRRRPTHAAQPWSPTASVSPS